MRRSVWEKIPYPETEFAEDQVWAFQVVSAGYEKIYADQAIVYHSHDYDEKHTEERAFTNAKFHLKQFGYEPVSSETAEHLLSDENGKDLGYADIHGVETAVTERRLKLNAARIAGSVRAKQGLADADAAEHRLFSRC